MCLLRLRKWEKTKIPCRSKAGKPKRNTEGLPKHKHHVRERSDAIWVFSRSSRQ